MKTNQLPPELVEKYRKQFEHTQMQNWESMHEQCSQIAVDYREYEIAVLETDKAMLESELHSVKQQRDELVQALKDIKTKSFNRINQLRNQAEEYKSDGDIDNDRLRNAIASNMELITKEIEQLLKKHEDTKCKREKLIDFMNWYNNNPKELIDNENVVDLYLNSHLPTISDNRNKEIHPITSQSPTIEQPLTLQGAMEIHRNQKLVEGDWFEGTEWQYRKVLEIQGFKSVSIQTCNEYAKKNGFLLFDRGLITWLGSKKTQLTPEEFLRRAENTFNSKNQ